MFTFVILARKKGIKIIEGHNKQPSSSLMPF